MCSTLRNLRLWAVAVLFCALATPAFAITWCHDYALWEASGRRLNKDQLGTGSLEAGTLDLELSKLDYVLVKVFPPNANADAFLRPGDVVVLGTAHSGHVNAQRRIDHLIQPPGAPGTQMTGPQAMASTNFKRDWTLAALWGPITRTDRQGNTYNNAPYGSAPAQIYRRAQVKQEYAGQLQKGMAKDRVRTNCYVRTYDYNFEAGAIYTLDLTSGNGQRGGPGFFDTWLRVEDGAQVLQSNDDGGEGLNARVIFTAPRSGTFRLVVTSFSSQATGSYVLTIRR